jgi:hypothetical protein
MNEPIYAYGFTALLFAGAAWVLSWAYQTVMAVHYDWPSRRKPQY